MIRTIQSNLKRRFGDDTTNIAWLIILYLFQGIPIGLTFGTIPFLLHKHSTYTQIGIFSLTGFPYSLKILWSPFVDSYYLPSFGRRKSWIVPIQLLAGAMFIWASGTIEGLLEHCEQHIWTITALFFIFIVLMATQDIAVDGWALTILSKANVHYASTCQTIGLNTGFFLSYTIFLALSSPEFSNKYLRTLAQADSDHGVITLSGYFMFWGLAYILFSLYLAVMKQEEPYIPQRLSDTSTSADSLEPMEIYKSLWRIITTPHIRMLCILLLTCKIVFQSNESALSLRLLEMGMKKEDLASFSIIQFPCVISFSIFAGKIIKDKPLTIWTNGYLLGMFFVFCNMVTTMFYQKGWTFYLILLAFSLSSSFSHTLMVIAQGGFFLRISDKNIGGTYLTLLNTVANLGGTWPKFMILYLIDKLTSTQCVIPNGATVDLIGTTDEIKKQCELEDGSMVTQRDGYIIVTVILLIYGVFMYNILRKKLIPIERIKVNEK